MSGTDQSAIPHPVAAQAACWSWRTILLGEGPLTRGCPRSRDCCRAQSLRIAIRLCTLEVRDIRFQKECISTSEINHSAIYVCIVKV